MQIKEIQCLNFRSFGQETSEISFDPATTYFVGQNHTGKSNLMKILHELKENHLPYKKNHVLSKDNWFNNESGIERPLKIIIGLKIDEQDYRFFCEKWILEPLTSTVIASIDSPSEKKDVKGQYSYEICRESLLKFFPLYECILRMEFIRISDREQLTNYSIQFNDLIAVNTSDGRQFLQYMAVSSADSRYRESTFWDINLFEIFTKLKSHLDGSVPDFNAILDIIITDPRKFIFSTESVDIFYRKFYEKLILVNGSKIISSHLGVGAQLDEVNLKFNESKLGILSNEIYGLVKEAPADEHLRFRMSEMQKHFEEMFQNLDIVFGFKDTSEGPGLAFYERSKNEVIQNFDSIGIGITDTLDFLYMLIVKQGYIFFIDSPEYLLHPHSQRHLYNLLKEHSDTQQIILATHSPYFFQPDDIFNLRLFNLLEGITRINRLDMPMNMRERYLLKRNFSVRNRDAIFADGLIFVEGPSEELTFPYFFSSFGLDLDLNNISLINIGGKASFAVFWKFAHQLKKKYWFFFDNDVLGVKAGDNITPELFKRSVIYKKRFYFSTEIVEIAENLVEYNQKSIEFQAQLELLRTLLQKFHIFIFPSDFEGIFEETLAHRVKFMGRKVAKAMQLVEFIKDHEDEQIIPDRLYNYIKIIKDEL